MSVDKSDNIDESIGLDDLDDLDILDDYEFSEDELKEIEEREVEERENDKRKFNECVFIDNKTLCHFDTKEDSKKSYFDEIIDFKIAPCDLKNSLYDYWLIEPKYLYARFLYYIRKSRRNGALSLEEDLKYEPSQLIKANLCMVVNGWEPNSIIKTMKMKKEWYKKSFLQYETTDAKEVFIKRVLQDFEAITYGVLYIQSADYEEKWLETFLKIYQNDNFNFKNEKELEKLHEEYLNIKKPFLLMDKSDYSHIKMNGVTGLKCLLDVFNEKRDALESMEFLTLEDPKDILNRLLTYAKRAREEGMGSLTRESLYDANMLIRHCIQNQYLQMAPDDLVDYIATYRHEKINLAKKYHNTTFCVLYEREVEFIKTAILSIMGGDHPDYIKVYWMSFYPELTIL